MNKRYDKELSPKELAAMSDKDIDYSDIPELDDDFWAKAEVRPPVTKSAISIRLDQDMLDWFKSQGKGYQGRINAVLRAYYESHHSQ